MSSTRPLDGKVALIAGASSGVGAATAVELASQGAAVAVVARRKEELESVREAVADHGVPATAVVADLAEVAAATHVHDECVRELGPVDILVNAAAAVQTNEVHRVNPRHWDLQMRLNLTTPFHLMHAVLPHMRQAGFGRIINFSSAVALEKIPGTAPYAVTKQGLNTLTELTDAENRGLGVRAIALCLGFVYSRLSPNLTEFGVDEHDLLKPEDVARVVSQFVKLDSRITMGSVLRLEPTSPAADTRRAVERHVQANLG